MKIHTTLLLLLFSALFFGQGKDLATDRFVVNGQIKKEMLITLADLSKYPTQTIPDAVITNHTGSPRGTAKQMTGILIKELLKDLQLKEENPKNFSEFYFTFEAIDHYKVVYSWNEIFNSPTGDHLFLITSRDGNPLNEMKERILVLTTSDFKTGRRHVKGLSSITVHRTE